MRQHLSVNRFIAAVAVAAAASLAATAAFGRGDVHVSLLVMLAVGFGITLAFPVRNALSTAVAGFELQEAVLLPALVLLPAWPTVAAFTVAAVVATAVRRRGLTKTTFNVAQWTVAIAAAYLVLGVVRSGSSEVSAQLPGAVLSVLVASLVNFGAVSCVVAVATGTPMRRVTEGHLGPSVIVWIGNVALGTLLVVVAQHELGFLPIVLVPAVMMQLAYRAIGERDVEGRRLRAIGRAEVAMAAAQTPDALARQLAASLAAILTARAVEVSVACPDGSLTIKEGDTGDGERPPRGVGEIERVVDVTTDCSLHVTVNARRNLDPFTGQDADIVDTLVLHAGEVLARLRLFEEVHREGQRVANILASSSDGIFSVDAAQRVQAWNPAMERITGLLAAEVVGGPCTVMGACDEQGSPVCPETCPGRCGFHGSSVPVQVTTPSGDTRWLNCTYSPMPDGGYVVVARDVTAQKEVDDLKADFLATVSHELRTPLTPIKGFLATLRERDGEFDADQRIHLYEVMQRQADRLERLVTDLLDSTTMGREGQLFLSEELEWPQTVGRVVEMFRRAQPDRDVVVEVRSDLPWVVADEQRAEQVLSNLLSNAAKYSPAGMPIRVGIEGAAGHVVTTVADAGPGIDPGQRERIFERFTRLGDYRTRTSGGAGLGLYIARRLVEGMGGTITVTEAPEGGAAFSFTLPAVDRAARRV